MPRGRNTSGVAVPLDEDRAYFLQRLEEVAALLYVDEEEVARLRQSRNDLVLRAVAAGATEREAARAAGVTGPFVNRLKQEARDAAL